MRHSGTAHLMPKAGHLEFRLATPSVSTARRHRRTGAVLLATLLELVVLMIFLGTSLFLITHQWNSVSDDPADELREEPAFRITATADHRSLWIQRGFQRLETYDTQTGQTSRFLPDDISSLTETRVSRDGQTVIAVIDDQDFHIFQNQQLLLVDRNPSSLSSLSALAANGRVAVRVIDGTLMRAWEIDEQDAQPFDSHLPAEAQRIALDPTGERLLVFSIGKGLSLHETRSGRLLMSLPLPSAAANLSADPEFTSDGTGVAVACGSTIVMYELTHGSIIWTSHVDTDSLGFNQLTVSADCRRIAAGGVVTGICVFTSSNGKVEHHIPGCDSSNRVAFSACGDHLYCGWSDGSIKVFSLSEGRWGTPIRKTTT